MAATSADEVNLSNWRISPYNEYSFANIDQILETEIIRKSNQPAIDFDRSTFDLSDFKVQLDQQTLDLPCFLASTNTDGFLVIHEGKLVHEHYAHGNNANSKHILMSMTKSVTGLIAGVLIQQGVLDTEVKVLQYVPEVKGTPYEHTTVRHLLDMRTGVQSDDESHEYRLAMGWEPANEGERTTNLLEFISGLDANSNAPGGSLEYRSVNTDVLGFAIERATGKKLSDLIHEYIWQPIGAESDALLTIDPSGNPRAAGGMCATVRDIARLGQGILSGRVISSSWLRDILTGGDVDLLRASSLGPVAAVLGSNMAYRNCWMADGQAEVMVAMGMHGQILLVDHKNEIVMVRTSSQPHPGSKIMAALIGFREIRRMLSVST